ATTWTSAASCSTTSTCTATGRAARRTTTSARPPASASSKSTTASSSPRSASPPSAGWARCKQPLPRPAAPPFSSRLRARSADVERAGPLCGALLLPGAGREQRAGLVEDGEGADGVEIAVQAVGVGDASALRRDFVQGVLAVSGRGGEGRRVDAGLAVEAASRRGLGSEEARLRQRGG